MGRRRRRYDLLLEFLLRPSSQLFDGGPLPVLLAWAETHRTCTVLVANSYIDNKRNNKRIKRAKESTRLRYASLPQIVGAQDTGAPVIKYLKYQ